LRDGHPDQNVILDNENGLLRFGLLAHPA
jgi:hypothetical protein